MARSVVILFCALVCGCGGPFEDGRAAVEANLRDPDSAQFSDLRRGPGGEICGRVKARNSFGGQSDWTRFFVDAGGVHLPDEAYAPDGPADRGAASLLSETARLNEAAGGPSYLQRHSCACFGSSDAETGPCRAAG